jgi:hypothetical protein
MSKHQEIELDYLRSQEIEMIMELERRLSKFKSDCHSYFMNMNLLLIPAILAKRPFDVFIELEYDKVKMFSRNAESLDKFREVIDKLK